MALVAVIKVFPTPDSANTTLVTVVCAFTLIVIKKFANGTKVFSHPDSAFSAILLHRLPIVAFDTYDLTDESLKKNDAIACLGTVLS